MVSYIVNYKTVLFYPYIESEQVLTLLNRLYPGVRSMKRYSSIHRCIPPTHEYDTRPFLRWARLQSRSPHASGKAKNTFGPVSIPLFGAPQAPGNTPAPEAGKSLVGWPPEAGGNLQCRGTPGRTAQR